MKFNSKIDVVEYLRTKSFLSELVNGAFVYGRQYQLQENEVASPHFVPSRFKDGWQIKVIHYYKHGLFPKREDGKCYFIGESYVVGECSTAKAAA